MVTQPPSAGQSSNLWAKISSGVSRIGQYLGRVFSRTSNDPTAVKTDKAAREALSKTWERKAIPDEIARLVNNLFDTLYDLPDNIADFTHDNKKYSVWLDLQGKVCIGTKAGKKEEEEEEEEDLISISPDKPDELDCIITKNFSLVQAALRAAQRKNRLPKSASPDDLQPTLETERPQSMWVASRNSPISFNFHGQICKAWTNEFDGVTIQIPKNPLISLSRKETTLYVSTAKHKDMIGRSVNDPSVKTQKDLFFAARDAAFAVARKKDEEERPPMFPTSSPADSEIPTRPDDDPPPEDDPRKALAAEISRLPPAPTSGSSRVPNPVMTSPGSLPVGEEGTSSHTPSMAEAQRAFCTFMDVGGRTSINFSYNGVIVSAWIAPDKSVMLKEGFGEKTICISSDGDVSSEGRRLKLNKSETATYQQMLSAALDAAKNPPQTRSAPRVLQ